MSAIEKQEVIELVNTDMLRDAIRKKNLTYKNVADCIDVTYATLRFKVRGEREFTASEIKKVSKLLKLSLSEMEKIFLN